MHGLLHQHFGCKIPDEGTEKQHGTCEKGRSAGVKRLPARDEAGKHKGCAERHAVFEHRF